MTCCRCIWFDTSKLPDDWASKRKEMSKGTASGLRDHTVEGSGRLGPPRDPRILPSLRLNNQYQYEYQVKDMLIVKVRSKYGAVYHCRCHSCRHDMSI